MSPTGHPAPAPSGGYASVRVLGSGAYGAAWLCARRQGESGSGGTGPEHRVAVVLHARPVTEAEQLALHTELLAAAAAARHPCTAPVHDVAMTPEGHGQLLLDWYPDGSFASPDPLPLDDVLIAGVRAALSLRAAHRRGVLHLDVRPGALLRGRDGEAYLSGHGIARAVERAAPGSGRPYDPAHAPRELAGWESPGPACDVYQLGATLYQLLSGTPVSPARPAAAVPRPANPWLAVRAASPASEGPATAPGEPADAGTATGSSASASPNAPDIADAVDAAYHAILRGSVPAPLGVPIPGSLVALLRRMLAPHPADRPSIGEVHGALCAMVPATAAERVPRLDPEPDEPDPLLRPDPPEEPYEDEEDDPEYEARQRRRRRWLWVMAGTAALLFAAGAYAIVQTGNAGKSRKNPPAASGSPSPGAGGPARLLTPSQGAQYAPRDVTTVGFGDSVQVAWQPPGDAAAQAQVAGYLVLAQDPQGAAVDRRQTPAGTSNAVFTLPRGSAAGPVCFTVTTLVRLPDGALGLAPAAQVCPARPSGLPSATPSGGKGTASPGAKATPPNATATAVR
ncbi:hypothetical protein [Yinghuangia soli]|uniref:non-specific serine/threonine protein kinase n=1 Tax=Yinghuangia soli TaxID=2908204 RepID=A0AA41PYB1_9ACTN|nr:hypothetical protein [Yinghuangia soli]MCF2528128.1 hypothetical protein [Yinghuangia soli]